jgi:hypothetical protein
MTANHNICWSGKFNSHYMYLSQLFLRCQNLLYIQHIKAFEPPKNLRYFIFITSAKSQK